MPDSIIDTNQGSLLIANGINRVLKWNGISLAAQTAGVVEPATACSMSGSGIGTILGTYYAYVRFVDADGNYSNLSPISAAYTTNGQTGTITNCTKAEPIVVTSANHGLLTGAKVKISGVEGMDEANGTWTITRVDANKFKLNNSAGANSYTGGGTWIAGELTINYSSVPVPTEDKVTTRQILRNTDGQATTFYVDVETSNLTSTTFSSTNTDTDLQSNDAVPLADADGNDLAISYYSLPPASKKVLCQHRGRIWMAAEVNYSEGAVVVTFGSSTVTGIKTEWSSQMVGRSFYVVGEAKRYTIATVNTSAQTLTLSANYEGTTDPYALYAIAPAPGERREVYFSAPNKPEAWPPTNVITVEENGDEITGLVSQASYLYILEKNHLYRLNYQDNPVLNGEVFLVSYRGCINNRCWIAQADGLYMLDHAGIHRFDGSGSEPISATIQELFQGKSDFFRINWKAAPYFHAVHDRPNNTLMWFVALEGNTIPRHALTYNYVNHRWGIEEYSVPIGCSAIVEIDGQSHVFLGGPSREVYARGTSELDATSAADGTVRGQPTSISVLSLTDSSATFSSSLALAPICIVGGRGKGQVRQIVEVSGTTLYINEPWSELPSVSGADQSTYQIGGIPWEYRTGWFHVTETENTVPRRLDVFYDPTDEQNYIDVEVYADHDDAPITWAIDFDDDHITITQRDSRIQIDSSQQVGYSFIRMDNLRDFSSYGTRWISFRISGAKGQDPLAITHIDARGLVTKSSLTRRGE